MAQRRRRQQKEPSSEQQQPYDNVLKSLLEDQEQQMLPYFLAGVQYLETLNVEVLRPPLRVDRVYKVLYQGHIHILHIEFESGSDKNMARRLLNYHSYLLHKYGYPVISIIVYPFETSMAESPFREISRGKESLIFHFDVLPLWKLNAQDYLGEHAVSLYALLPTMAGADAAVLNQAIDELLEFYQGNDEKLARELYWLGIMLRRAEVMPLPDKQEIAERLSMYDELTEQDPKIKKIRKESEAKGRAEGKAQVAKLETKLAEMEAKAAEAQAKAAEAQTKATEMEAKAQAAEAARTEALQHALVTVVEGRFPPLTELVQQKVTQIDKPDTLNRLLKGVTIAPDEASVRLLLEVLAA